MGSSMERIAAVLPRNSSMLASARSSFLKAACQPVFLIVWAVWGFCTAAVTDRYIDKLFYLDVPDTRTQVETGIREFRNAGFSLYGPAEKDSSTSQK
jgi:hypothetical protein